MKKHSFKFFIKQKQIAIDKLLAQIANINQEFKEIEDKIQKKQEYLNTLQNLQEDTIFSLKNKEQLQKEIKKRIKEYLSKKEKLEKEIEELKATLLQTNSEKKALEKLMKKEDEIKHLKQTQQENELANESYLRKNYTIK